MRIAQDHAEGSSYPLLVTGRGMDPRPHQPERAPLWIRYSQLLGP